MKHPFDFSDDALASMSDRIGVLETEVDELTAENAKLRAELAEAESALKAIADMTMSMVVNVQHMNDERGRIARAYLSKHTATA